VVVVAAPVLVLNRNRYLLPLWRRSQSPGYSSRKLPTGTLDLDQLERTHAQQLFQIIRDESTANE